MISETDRTGIKSEQGVNGHAWVVAIAGWLVPGLGHLMLKRIGRGLLLMGAIFGMLFLGFAFGGHLYGLSGPDTQGGSSLLRIPPVIANLGTGLPYLICALFNVGFSSRAWIPTSEYGNTFLWVAGLLNYLAALDAFDIAVGRKP
jgi:hypothetical protein